MNRSLILNMLRREGVLSRTQITEISGLSVATVSQITNDLIENHWIIEIGEGEYTGGRRQMLLRLNPDRRERYRIEADGEPRRLRGDEFRVKGCATTIFRRRGQRSLGDHHAGGNREWIRCSALVRDVIVWCWHRLGGSSSLRTGASSIIRRTLAGAMYRWRRWSKRS